MNGWQLDNNAPNTWLIHDGERVIGSMVLDPSVDVHVYRVEILWSGPGGDIGFESENLESALSFIKGVEKAFSSFLYTIG